MRKQMAIMATIATAVLFSGCQLIGGIFKAGVWVGVLIVVAVIALIIFIIAKAGSKY